MKAELVIEGGCLNGVRVDPNDPNHKTRRPEPNDPDFDIGEYVRAGAAHFKHLVDEQQNADGAEQLRELLEQEYAEWLRLKRPSPGTIKKYGVAFGKFRIWCDQYGFSARPTAPAIVASYLDHLFKMERAGVSVIKTATVRPRGV